MISVLYTIIGILLPFFGTSIGAAAVFLFTERHYSSEKAMSAFAAGVMVAASVWSLIVPATEMCSSMGRLSFLPVLIGIATGSVIMIISEKIRHIATEKNKAALPVGKLFVAVTLHNFPEGMAVGLMFSSWLSETGEGALAGAFAFSLAIAIQNIPEGAIISLPDYAERKSRLRSFGLGVISGIVEPLGAVLTLVAASLAERALPYFFGFAAGTMLYVVADELLEKDEKHPLLVPLSFILGFSVMMILDIALG